MEKKDVEFPDGMRSFSPRDNAPEKLVSNLVFDGDFVKWLSDKLEEDKEVRIGIWWSNDGTRHYTQVDNWKPDPNRRQAGSRPAQSSGKVKAKPAPAQVQDDEEEELPF